MAVLTATLFAAAPARASLVQALDTGDLTHRADLIAVADVLSVRSDWDADHRKIYTTVDLQVVESWKGGAAPASRITVVQPGGTVGDITMVVFGLSRFAPGERALLFLRGATTSAAVVGMTQGKRSMRRDQATGRWMVDAPDRSGVKLVAPPASARATPVAPIDYRSRPVEELRSEIQELIKVKR